MEGRKGGRGGRSRVQGAGWSGRSRRPVTCPSQTPPHSSDTASGPPQHFAGQSGGRGLRFVAGSAGEEVLKTRRIEAEGTHTLSEGPSGISKIDYYPALLAGDNMNYFESLRAAIRFREAKNRLGHTLPRLIAWFGEHPYNYSGINHDACPEEMWPDVLCVLKSVVEEKTGRTFNSVLANLYENEKNSVDWHSDDEPALGCDPYIASLSFGDLRMFEMRKKPDICISQCRKPADEDFRNEPRLEIPLNPGSLLVMRGKTQTDWQHRIPKSYHDKKPRINLTFRTVYPPSH